LGAVSSLALRALGEGGSQHQPRRGDGRWRSTAAPGCTSSPSGVVGALGDQLDVARVTPGQCDGVLASGRPNARHGAAAASMRFVPTWSASSTSGPVWATCGTRRVKRPPPAGLAHPHSRRACRAPMAGADGAAPVTPSGRTLAGQKAKAAAAGGGDHGPTRPTLRFQRPHRTRRRQSRARGNPQQVVGP
jgi:hypothetical protein